MYAYIPSLWSLSPTRFHPSRSSQSTELSSLGYAAASQSGLFYARLCLYIYASLSVHPILSFPHCAHKSVLNVCISIPVLQIGPSAPFF